METRISKQVLMELAELIYDNFDQLSDDYTATQFLKMVEKIINDSDIIIQ